MAEMKKAAENEKIEVSRKDLVEKFIQRKMKAINEMDDHDTARYLAGKVIDNRKGV